VDIAHLSLAVLGLITALVLLLPFSVKKVEEELEIFLFVMGLAAVTVSGRWSLHLVHESIIEPIKIAAAVLIVGFIFRALRPRVRRAVTGLEKSLGRPLAMAAIVFFLGLSSSLITAIIAALVLAEVVTAVKLDRRYELRFTICACYAIGLGAALTPLGEPLSTIVTAKLKGPPHNADFFFLARLLGLWIVPGVLAAAALSAWKVGHPAHGKATLSEDKRESSKDIVARAVKVYLFVMALVYLGSGLAPVADRAVHAVPDWALYWINSVSAVLDNATLAAAEIVPSMSERKITFVLMGLLVSGGMLIPGNIPNIICASKLGIRSREWAVAAVPMGLVFMAAYFLLLLAFQAGL
jgi:predicted cation transporter